MSTTVARIDAILDVDGRGVPRKVRRISEQAGREAGDGFGDEFNDSLDKHLTDWGNTRLNVMRERFEKAGDENGRIFGTKLRDSSDRLIKDWVDNIVDDIAKVFTFSDSDEWDKWVKNADSVSLAYQRMSDNIQIAYNEGRLESDTADLLNGRLLNMATASRRAEVAQERLAAQHERSSLALAATEERLRKINDIMSSRVSFDRYVQNVGGLDVAFGRLNKQIDEYERSLGGDQASADKMRTKLLGLADASHKASDGVKDLDANYRGLPHGLRQAIFWVTLVVGAFENLSVLGSAAGGGIIIAGAALSGLAFGAGVAFAAFKDLGEKLEDLPAASRPAKLAFDQMTDAFGALQDKISARVLSQVAPAFERLAGAVAKLEPSFLIVADAVATATDNLSKLFASDKGIKAWAGAIEAAAPIFEDLVGLAGDLVVAVLQVFGNKEVQRGVQEFIGWLDKLVERFDEFTQNGGLDEWMQNTRDIFAEIEPLLDRVGTLFNELVTPETVERTAAFIESLTGAMDLVQDIVEVAGELDVFGLAAQALETLGAVLGPVLEVLKPIADIIGTVIGLFMEMSQVFWSFLQPIFIPLQLAWQIVNLALERFIDWAQPVIDALIDMGEEVGNLGDDIWEDLEPALGDLFDAFLTLLPEPEELARIIRQDVIPQIKNFASWIENTAIPAIESFIDWIGDVVEALGGWDGIGRKLAVVGAFFTGFYIVVSTALQPIIWLINSIKGAIDNLLAAAAGARAVGAGLSNGGKNPGGMTIPRFGAGGLVAQRTFAEIGEAGRELVVPLDQPLSRVAPEVRDVAAYAQGKGGAGLGGAYVAEGAIAVYTLGDPYAAGHEVLYQLTERLNG